MKLLVAIHDVSPAHAQSVQRIWNHCVATGVQSALLVVPNWHGEWPIADYRVFTDWLRECQRSGAEILLHGERHDEHGTQRTLSDELRAFGRTDHEAEFLTLRFEEARQRIERGLKCLESFGLSPVGFVAPAWLAHDECAAALVACNVAISETADAISLHRRGTRLHSPVIRWSTRAAWRVAASELVARATTISHGGHWLMRIAFHPGDVEHPGTWSSACETLSRWLERRRPWRYAAL